jgi:2-oxoglutarate dehydrogenase E2 component (dihydrolipoamide succinyltransferase)
VGDAVQADETICEVSTDKIDTEVPAPAGGRVAEILVEVDQTVAVGTVLARIATGAGDPPAGNGHQPRRHSPVVQRIAAEHGIDLDQVEGTGRGGRVRKQDVLAFLEQGGEEREAGPAQPAPAPTQLSRMRRSIGEHMKRSLETAATCTTWIEVDMSAVEAARERLELSYLPFVARAAVDALRDHPTLNAWLEDERFTVHDDVNLGIAVSLGDDGLIVPVVRRAQELSAEGLGARIRELASRARAGDLTADDVRGGTFTITNPGQFGSIMATPIIHQPQVAILDLEAVVKRPVAVTGADGQDAIAIRPMTILGLSWDHRALDGALAARFLARLQRALEGWSGG